MSAPSFFRYDTWVSNTLGNVVVGADVYVCRQPATTTTVPPSPLASIFYDNAGTQPVTQPLQTDNFGHADFYAAPGLYTIVVVVYSPQGTQIQVFADQNLGLASASASFVLSGNSPIIASALASLTDAPVNTPLVADGAGNVEPTSGTLQGPLSIAGGLSSPEINNIVFLDGTTYPLTGVGLAAAISAATANGTKPGKVIIPPTANGAVIPLTSTIVLPSNLTIEGPGVGFGVTGTTAFPSTANVVILQASTSFGTLMTATNVSNVVLKGFALDGNQTNNGSLNITGCTNIILDDLRMGNGGATTALGILGGNTFIKVQNCELYRCGVALPSAAGGGAVVDGGPNSHIQFVNCSIHDNNVGLAIFNSTVPTQANEDILIMGCSVFSNCNDGILVSANVLTGGLIKGVRIIGNESYSNGWPANGNGFSPNTAPGWLQNGSTLSPSGVGIDVTVCNLLQELVIIGNRCHDNVYDGISIDGHLGVMSVTASGTGVTWVSGPKFNLQWKNGQPIVIGSNTFFISSVASATSLTLTTSAGGPVTTTAYSSSDVFATISGNTCFNNGNIPNQIGTGFFCYFANRVSYGNNIAYNNADEGFGVNSSADVSYTNCKGYNNSLSGNTSPAGFQVFESIGTSIIGCSTDDNQATPTQTNGVYISSGSIGTLVQSPSIYGSTPISDNGTDTVYMNAGGSLKITSGVISEYNGVTTTGNGIPCEVAGVALISQSAAISAHALFTPAVSGLYRITFQAKVTQVATSSSTLGGSGGFSVSYKDNFDNTTSVVSVAPGGTSTGNALTTDASSSVMINAVAGTAVTFSYGYTSSGATAMNFYIQVIAEQL